MRALLFNFAHRSALASEPYAPARANFGDSTDEQTLSYNRSRYAQALT